MAWDPTQGQGQTGNGGPEPNPGFGAPQNPYERQGQPASGADPYSGYGTPQNPYGAPSPQNPYGTPPPQNPYASSPPQNPYGTPPPHYPQYGTSSYQQGGYGYGYAPPQQAPRSIGRAIRELPNQYIKVLTKPSARSFAEEMGKAAWDITWVQILLLTAVVVIPILLAGLFATVLISAIASGNSSTPIGPILAVMGGGLVVTALLLIVFVPIGFFIGTGIQYLIAKAFGGQGNFLTHCYTFLLYQVPLLLVTMLAFIVFGFIPFINLLAYFLLIPALGIYGIVLNIFMLISVHRLSGGKATLVYFIPTIAVVLFSCVLSLLTGSLFHPATPTPY